ncbi:MAG: zinc transporter ZupT [Bacteroidia bacterium]|jgi:zinc transporter ZupT
MTQHEYVFIAISITLGLAITRLLHTVAMLIRARRRVSFHWATAVWAFCVMFYILQLWWVGWGLRSMEAWAFTDFLTLMAASICIYGAAEMALPVPDEDHMLDFLTHSQGIGRLSAVSMLLYFLMGPYVNITMFRNDVAPSIVMPILGIILMATIVASPRAFRACSALFALYTAIILVLTA